MKISYNWLKSYIPDAPEAKKLADILTYHLTEVESVEENRDGDFILDVNVLPNRAHDLLSHQGLAREIASLLEIKYVDPTPKYKIPKPKTTKLVKTIESKKCRRYTGRIIRNVKVGPSPEWVVKHLESIGQRSINNIVDATNIVMFDCGQPAHVFDMSKIKNLKMKVRNAKDGEKVSLLGGEEKTMDSTMMVIADDVGNVLDIAGIKGGTYAELTADTTDIILEIANFDPVSVRKTAQALNIFTDARKRFENDLSPSLAPYAMRELSALILEMCPDAVFEDVVDIYPKEQETRKLVFRAQRISGILGKDISVKKIKDILGRYSFKYTEKNGKFEMDVPPMRLDLVIEEDMAEEIGRVMGYDEVKPKTPNIKFIPKTNETYSKILWARNKLLEGGYSEVMTYAFTDRGHIQVQKSASDKKFLRTNLTDGLTESMKLNKINAPLLGLGEARTASGGVKIFEIGTVFGKKGEELHIAYNEKEKIIEKKLDEFCKEFSAREELSTFNFRPSTGHFVPWSLFPFIARDIAVWVPEGVGSKKVGKIIKDNAGELLIRGPELFDEFKKDKQISYAFKLVFQSFDRTLTDAEINEIMTKISNKIQAQKTNGGTWQVR
jgi:phenylalanyl-tRNA synthetase beta chain